MLTVMKIQLAIHTLNTHTYFCSTLYIQAGLRNKTIYKFWLFTSENCHCYNCNRKLHVQPDRETLMHLVQKFKVEKNYPERAAFQVSNKLKLFSHV